MTMVTVPLAVLIGAAIGILLAGGTSATSNDEMGEYCITTVICCGLFILICCVMKALIKAGGA